MGGSGFADWWAGGLILVAWSLLLSMPLPAQFVIDPYRFAVASSYTAETAGFDGTDDTIERTVDTANWDDAKTFSLSVWLDFTGGDGVRQKLAANATHRWVIEKNASDQIALTGLSTGGASILAANSAVTKVAADGWFHLAIFVDLANSSNRGIYFDGVEDGSVTWTTYSNSTIDLERNLIEIGGGPGAVDVFQGSMAEFWLDDGYWESDVADFISGGGPADGGSDGSGFTGLPPAVYLSRNGSGDSWAIDSSGNGNDFTVNSGPLGSPASP